MFGYFYNNSMRRYTMLMGALFNNVHVRRVVGDEERFINVPVSFASKEAFVKKMQSRLERDDGTANIKNILPRMSLEITDLVYDEIRKTNDRNRSVKRDSNKPTGYYNPVPYNITYTLSIWTKHEDDLFQILEQIVPYFTPSFSAKVEEMQDAKKENRSVPISLTAVIPSEDYEMAMGEQRRIEWQLVFMVKGYFYPPKIDFNGEIRRVFIDFYGNQREINENSVFESFDREACEPIEGISKTSMSENIDIPEDENIRGEEGECKEDGQ